MVQENLYKYFDTYQLLEDALKQTRSFINSMPNVVESDFDSYFDEYGISYKNDGKTYVDAYKDFLTFLLNQPKDLIVDMDYPIEFDDNMLLTIGFYTEEESSATENGTEFSRYGYEFTIDLDTMSVLFYQHINHN